MRLKLQFVKSSSLPLLLVVLLVSSVTLAQSVTLITGKQIVYPPLGTQLNVGSLRMAVSAVFMLTRHCRDVVLPNLTEMNIILNRPLILSASESAPSATVEPGSGLLIRPSWASRQ